MTAAKPVPAPPPPAAEPSATRLALSLGLAGLVSGLVLVGVYLATLPTIQANQADALQGAILRVLPGADTYEAMTAPQNKLVVDPAYQGKPPAPGVVVYAGKNAAGAPVGYAIPAEGNGFMDTIGLIYGYDPKSERIVGMEVLQSRETPGLGDKIVTDKHFLANFNALAIKPAIEPTKHGAKTKDWQVDCITGATISSKAVVAILNRSITTWAPRVHPAEDPSP